MHFLYLFALDFVGMTTGSSVGRGFSSSHQQQVDLTSTCPNQNGSLEAVLREELYSFCVSEQRANAPLQAFQNLTGHETPPSFDSKSQCLKSSRNSEDYCIHTSSIFAKNRSLSILATPSSISTILNSTGFKTPPALYLGPKSNHIFYEADISSRGKDLIANRTFQPGDLILSSTPVLIIGETIGDIFSHEETVPFQRQAVESLSLEAKKLFYDLAGQFGGDRREDIIRTNAFGTRFGGKGKFGVVVPEAAVSSCPSA